MKRGNNPENGGCVKLVRGSAFSVYDATLSSRSAASPTVGCYVSFHGENAGKKTARTVQSRHLICHDNGWYLITDDLRSGKDRKFLLSRVESVKATGKRFTPKRKLDLKKLRKNLGIFSTGKEETVRLDCGAAIRQLIVERIWHESQEITELPDGGVN